MHAPMDKHTLIALLEAERQHFNAAIAHLTDDELVSVPLEVSWTGKDLLAHISAWEAHLLEWLATAEQGQPLNLPEGSGWDPYIETFNMQAYERNRERSLEAIRHDYAAVYATLLERLGALPDRGDDPRWAPWKDGLPPWGLLLTYPDHYRHHGQSVTAWIMQQAASNP